MGTLLNTEVIEEVKGAAVIGLPNVVANPGFQNNTNFWSASALVLTITGSGIQAIGSGNLYQILNTTDVSNGLYYMGRVYCNTVSGSWSLLVGSAVDSSSVISQSLSVGWNSVRFTAGANNYLQLKSTSEASTDTLVASPVEVREQTDLTVTGQIRALDIEYGDVYFSSGSVTAPSISFESDKDTGVYLASTAQMALVTSGITQISLLAGSGVLVASNLRVGGHASVVGSIYAAGATISALTGVVTTTSQIIISGIATITGSINSAGATFSSAVTFNGTVNTFTSNLIVSGPFVAPSFSAISPQVVCTSQLVAVGVFYAQSTATITGSINSAGVTSTSGIVVGGAGLTSAQAIAGAIIYSGGFFYGFTGSGYTAFY